MAKTPASIYQLKVTLDGIRPPIWRRLLVPGNASLLRLHDILQVAMGWSDMHLHQFVIGGQNYGNPQDDEWGDLGLRPETRFKLSQVAPVVGSRFRYEYDFGDGWAHTLVVEEILPPRAGVRVPYCVKGKRACPPEDVGGVWGYEHFLEAIADPRHEEHAEYLEWVGGAFDPDDFDIEAVNASLRRMGRGAGGQTSAPRTGQGSQPAEHGIDLHSSWPLELPADQQAVAEQLPLRRDLVALLTYLRDNRVTGTQATGNLPLKAVREVCARMVDPPELEHRYGEEVFRVRSEADVRPLWFLHALAVVAGLAAGGPTRRWRLTPAGEAFVNARATVQVWLMVATWWTRVNWTIVLHYVEPGFLPSGVERLTLKRLMAIPAGEPATFEPFADRLIADAGLEWRIEDQEMARGILRGIVESAVIRPLEDFGIVTTEDAPDRVLGPRFRELVAFRITPFGQGLLDAIAQATAQARR